MIRWQREPGVLGTAVGSYRAVVDGVLYHAFRNDNEGQPDLRWGLFRGDEIEPLVERSTKRELTVWLEKRRARQNPLEEVLSNPSPRVKQWIKTLLQHGSDIGHAIGFTLGPVLGCGHWGCVVDLPSTPWVLKLTIDPTEAFVWRRIVDLIEAESYGQGGFPRVKGIYALQPGITYGSKGRKPRICHRTREGDAGVQ